MFITMTFNSNHSSILKALPHGVSPADRPDIVLQIFHQQVLQLAKLLIDWKVPGWEPMKAIIAVVEFQKRGLPHVHIRSIFDRVDHILAEEINKYSLAEIPNKNEIPEDWKNVVSFMIHRPCDSVNPYAPCCQNKNGEYDHNFPQEYCAVSSCSEPDCSPIYRSRTPSEGGARSLVRLRLNKRWLDYEYTSKYVLSYNVW